MAITDRKEIERLVREEVGRLSDSDVSGIDGDMDFTEGLKADSLYILEMYAMIEATFGVTVPIERLPDMYSINQIVDIIVEEQAKG